MSDPRLLLRQLIRTFFPDYLRIVEPDSAGKMRLDLITFPTPEKISEWTEDDQLDLGLDFRIVAEVPIRRGEFVTILVQVEAEAQTPPEAARRLGCYLTGLELRYGQPVLLSVVYLRGGRGGIHLESAALAEVFGIELVRIFYTAFCLEEARAEYFLERPEPLRLGPLRPHAAAPAHPRGAPPGLPGTDRRHRFRRGEPGPAPPGCRSVRRGVLGGRSPRRETPRREDPGLTCELRVMYQFPSLSLRLPSPRGAASAVSSFFQLPLREVLVNRVFFRSFAQGRCCLSAGFLAFGLGGLIPPGLAPAAPPGEPAPAPPALQAVAPQQTQPAPHPTPTPPLAPIPSSPVPPAPAEPAPQTVVAVTPPESRAPQAPPSPLHFLDTHKIPSGPFGDLIFEIAGRYSLNPHLVAAVVRVESSFNPRAMSRKGACGLMQLLPETARRFGLRRRDIFDPAKNLEAGVRYLKWLSDRFGHDPVRVLAAYNAGEGAVQKYGGVPPYKETRSYVQRIYSMLGLDAAPAQPPVKSVETVLGR